MIRHADLTSAELFGLLRRGQVQLAGHRPGRIYGTLRCPSGRRMKRENRVFFATEAEALAAGFRPCARCMPHAYRRWIGV